MADLSGLPAACPLDFTVDDATYTLPDLDTRTWLQALTLQPPGNWWHLIPMELPEPQGTRLLRRLHDPDDTFDLDNLEQVATTVLGSVCGMQWHGAARLAVLVYSNWVLFDGWCWSRGTSPLTEPIGRVLAAAYHWRRSMCVKDSELARLDDELWAQPATTVTGKPVDAAPPSWDDKQEADTFAAAMGALGARGHQ